MGASKIADDKLSRMVRSAYRASLCGLSRALVRSHLPRRPIAYASEALIRVGLAQVDGRLPEVGNIVVGGLFGDPSGLGRGARLAASVLQDRQPVKLDFGSIVGSSQPVWPSPDQDAGLAIIHLNPPALRTALAMMGPSLLRHRRVVAYWVWELEKFPDYWRRSFGLVDEIWTPSRFTASAFLSAGIPESRVRVVPHPVPVERAKPDPERWRKKDGDVLCLTLAAGASNFARKNADGAIRAFRAAAGARTDVKLIVKCSRLDVDAAGEVRLMRQLEGDPRIEMVKEELTDQEMQRLYSTADVFISLHRSEGFGLGVFDAMAAGASVLATTWSAVPEYLDESCGMLVPYELVKVEDPQGVYADLDAVWAEPNESDAIQKLTLLIDDSSLRLRLGSNAQSKAFLYSEEARATLRREVERAMQCCAMGGPDAEAAKD